MNFNPILSTYKEVYYREVLTLLKVADWKDGKYLTQNSFARHQLSDNLKERLQTEITKERNENWEETTVWEKAVFKKDEQSWNSTVDNETVGTKNYQTREKKGKQIERLQRRNQIIKKNVVVFVPCIFCEVLFCQKYISMKSHRY